MVEGGASRNEKGRRMPLETENKQSSLDLFCPLDAWRRRDKFYKESQWTEAEAYSLYKERMSEINNFLLEQQKSRNNLIKLSTFNRHFVP